MRFFSLSFLLLFSSPAFSVDYRFDNVPLHRFAEVVFNRGFARQHIISPDIKDKPITFNVSVSDEDAFPVVERALRLHGVLLHDDGTIITLLPLPSASHFLPSASDSSPSLPSFPSSSPFPSPFSPSSPSLSAADSPADQPVLALPAVCDVHTYLPKFREVSFLSDVVVFSGARVLPKQDSSILVFCVSDDEQLSAVNRALSAADFPEPSVHLHVVFIEITDSGNTGFSLSGLIRMLAGRFSVNFGTSDLSGISFSLTNTSVDSVLSFLDGFLDYRYLAEPYLSVSHNREAKLVVGSDVPLRGSVGRDSSGVTMQSVAYKTTGLQFSVRPFIYSDYVLVNGQFEVSSISANSSSSIDSPLILRRSISTSFPLRDSEVVILGGLDDERGSRSRSSFLGRAFSSRSENVRSRIIVLAEMRRGSVLTDIDQERQKVVPGAGSAGELANPALPAPGGW
jgi:type II secretory pathway component GspD/PulD (secretin)